MLRVPRDPEFIDALLPKLVEFHEVYVVPGVEPPAGGTDADAEAVKVAQAEDAAILAATPEQAEVVAVYRGAARVAAAAEYELDQAKNRVRQLIGDAAGLVGPFGKVTNREQPGRIAYATVVREHAEALAALLGAVEHPDDLTAGMAILLARDVLEESVKRNTGKPTRVLRAAWADEQEDE